MNLAISVDQKQLMNVLLNVGTVRPVFIWGAPGIGKSAIVEQFAADVGLECVSLLGSQLAPEDIIGVPQIVDGRSVFCPPRMIARDEPYCLFLDELNACSQEVQKAFYSLILERRIGEYHLPEGSIVIGAGNRAQDNAITRPMSSALLNRLDNGCKIVIGQNHICRILCNVCTAFTHGTADIRRLEGGCIVNSVARHCNNFAP